MDGTGEIIFGDCEISIISGFEPFVTGDGDGGSWYISEDSVTGGGDGGSSDISEDSATGDGDRSTISSSSDIVFIM